MARLETVAVPDIGNFDKVDVIDILVAPGDTVTAEQSLISLESDKASMDVPSPFAGKVKEIAVKNGAKVGKGDVILTLEVEEGTGQATKAEATSPLPPGEGQGEGGKPPSPPASAPLTPTLSRRERETSAPPTAQSPIDEASFARAY